MFYALILVLSIQVNYVYYLTNKQKKKRSIKILIEIILQVNKQMDL